MMKLGRSRSTAITTNKPRATNTTSHQQQCKKHPKHRQSPGVCSLCLSDKLSRVSSAVSAARTRARARVYYSSSSSLSSSDDEDDSYLSSLDASPPRATHHRRIMSDAKPDPVVLRMNMIHIRTTNGDEKKKKNNNNNNAISGFWSKLIGPRFRNKERSSHDHPLNKMVSRSQPLSSSLAVY